jgi:hypothetical protein
MIMLEMLLNMFWGSITRYIITGGIVLSLMGGNAIQYYRYKSLKGEYKAIQAQIDECTAQLKIANKAGDSVGRYTEDQCEAVKKYYEKLLKIYRNRSGDPPADRMQR